MSENEYFSNTERDNGVQPDGRNRLKTHLSDPALGGDADLVQFSVFRGDDGAVVVQIDTDEGLGHLRVNINEAPVFDQDPEQPSRINYEALERSL